MELFAMGDYGAYVWSSYLLTIVVVVIGTIRGRQRHQQVTDAIRRRLMIKETDE